MKLQELLTEARGYTEVQEFIIKSWGKLLYLDYFTLPAGPDMSSSEEFLELVMDYGGAEADGDEDEIETLDEWIGEGARLKNGKYLLSRKTVDAVLSSAQHKAGRQMTLYRFDHTPSQLKPDAWISLTKVDGGYDGKKSEYAIEPDDMIIDALDLADEDEVIVSSNLLIRKAK